MTSTTAPSTAPEALVPGLPDAVIPTEPDGLSDTTPRRRSARFPGLEKSAAAPGPSARPRVCWIGPEGPLRELVRDHTMAVGAELSDVLEGGAAACVVADADALAHRAGVLGRERAPLLVVTSRSEVPAAVWPRALAAGARAVIPLPGGSEELLSRLADLARPRSASLLLGVAGGCGGAGASSFAARLAAAFRSRGPVTLIDADPLSGGLDLLVEAPTAPGISWAETADLGPDDGEALREGLPIVDEVRLLVAQEGSGPDRSAVSRVLSALAPLGGTVVVDLSSEMVPAAAEHLDHLLVLVPATDHAVSSATRRMRAWQLSEGLAQAVVRRSGPLNSREVCEDLALPLAATFHDSTRGAVPLLDVRRRGADRAARMLVSALTTSGRS
ncbi:hypothetical protein [Brachybacterium sp. AOP29-B2-41]|uniref:hypothetical protein n=1 Tax=Brachybacterium sp. AOP29-B2-41 TaxID=3457704 RepID=UPI0040341142